MRLNLLLQPSLVRLVLLGCFCNKTPLDLKDHVLIGLENLKIAKQGIVPMIVRHWPFLRLCPEYRECIYLEVNVF